MINGARETVISARGLTKGFGRDGCRQVVLEQLDLDIYRGDFTVIMGPSGAGKSTLLYVLSGMDRPETGEITFGGRVITALSDDQLAVFRRKNCGFVFQQIHLLDKMSLMDNVLVAGALSGRSKKELVNRASALFAAVHLPPETQKKYPSQISGGEAQRAGMVRAVINRPAVVFADEPTGALNGQNSEAVLEVFTGLHQNGQSIIMVTHDKKSAQRGNRILYLKDGRLYGECVLGNFRLDDTARTEKLNGFLAEMGW